jgi:hypothetical protein
MNKWKHITGLVLLWLLFSAGTFLCLYQFVFHYGKVKVVVDYTAYKKEDITIYWVKGDNWAEENHLTQTTKIGRGSYTYYIRHSDTVTSVRVDPDEACDSCILHSISVEGIQHPFSCSDFSKNEHYNSSVAEQHDGLKIYRDRDSDDPYLIVPVPAKSGAVLYQWKGYELILIILALLFDIAVLIYLFRIRFLKTFFQKQQMSKIFIVFAFLLCISMYWTDRVLDFYPQQPNIENRKLVKFPKWKSLVTKTDSFFIDCTQWCSDYFNYHNLLIKSNSALYLSFLGESSMPKQVLIGKHHMFFPSFAWFMDDFMGKMIYPKGTIDTMVLATKAKHDSLAAHGIHFLVIVPPSKQTVYNDYMPEYYRMLQKRPSLLDQVTDAMKNAGITYYISLADTLKNMKQHSPEKQLYYDNDTHWNEYGAFKGYQVMMNYIYNIDSCYGKPVNEKDISIDSTQDDHGDLAKCLVINDINKRNIFHIQPFYSDSIPHKTKHEKKHKSPTYIYNNPHGHGKVLFYRDSYMVACLPFFIHHFRESVFIWDSQMDMNEILKYKPDLVILENGELFINNLAKPIQ